MSQILLIDCECFRRIIVTEMIDEILNQILTMMKNLPADSISQTIYVQFLFDVRYLLALLVPIENDVSAITISFATVDVTCSRYCYKYLHHMLTEF